MSSKGPVGFELCRRYSEFAGIFEPLLRLRKGSIANLNESGTYRLCLTNPYTPNPYATDLPGKLQ
jgi:hypothetical protein